jgi:hypothetical protein
MVYFQDYFKLQHGSLPAFRKSVSGKQGAKIVKPGVA